MSQQKSVFRNSLILSVLLLLASGSAFAQATRTWVSGVGDDVNPCSRTAPCKTWAGAISKTATGGIINCIDPGGFGAVTVTKSITISCKQVEGSALASSTNGIIINGAGIDVVLRGLDIDGGAPASPGLNGIRFLQGASLIVEDCVIRDFTGANPNGNGIIVNNTSLTAEIHIINSNITGNGIGASGAGIQIAPTGTGGARVTITNSNFSNNVIGVRASTAATTGLIFITATDTTVAGSSSHGFFAEGTSGAIRMMLNRVASVNNLGDGVRSTGANAIVRIGSSVVTSNNGTGLIAASGGQLQSYGNNQVDSNAVDGTATAIALK
ncbi:MAG: right-handed parallel beta-helix repeat-containing protein [Bradyrhizobium sp.]